MSVFVLIMTNNYDEKYQKITKKFISFLFFMITEFHYVAPSGKEPGSLVKKYMWQSQVENEH